MLGFFCVVIINKQSLLILSAAQKIILDSSEHSWTPWLSIIWRGRTYLLVPEISITIEPVIISRHLYIFLSFLKTGGFSLTFDHFHLIFERAQYSGEFYTEATMLDHLNFKQLQLKSKRYWILSMLCCVVANKELMPLFHVNQPLFARPISGIYLAKTTLQLLIS